MQKILIVDDEPAICSACKLILSEEGYDVTTALSGREARDQLSTQYFDLVLLDINLPDIYGINLLKEINQKKDAPHIIIIIIIIIIMTGHGTVKNTVSAMKHGAFDYLTKPFDVFPILIPPLRERKDDIPRLVYHFLNRFCKKAGKQISGFSDEALDTLVNVKWPGNVRQLKNVVERLVIMADGTQLNRNFLWDNLEIQKADPVDDISVPRTAEELKAAKKYFPEHHFGKVETAFLHRTLKTANGNITRAAKQVGMQRSNFPTLMKKCKIQAPEK